MTKLIQAVINNTDKEGIIAIYNEIQRGIDYANSQPGSINELLVRMALGLIGPVIVDYQLEKKSKRPKLEKEELNELKMLLKKKKEERIVNKMTGSLSSLLDLDE